MAKMSDSFSASRFLSVTPAERQALCAELSSLLTQRLGVDDFDALVRETIAELRALGHDLWSYEEEEEFEEWGPSYVSEGSIRSPGLHLSFQRGEHVEVTWRGD